MSDIIPVASLNGAAAQIVEHMRQRIARQDSFGVTVQGTHVTLRWNEGGFLRSVTMVVDAVDDGTPEHDAELDK